MIGICGANCKECPLYQKECKGCKETNGCPFGKKCWIAKYLELGEESFQEFKIKVIMEINHLEVEGMPKIEELFPLHGTFINLEYSLPNGKTTKLLKDEEAYLGNQVKCLFDEEKNSNFGIVCNTDFILISKYEENGSNPEIILYQKR